MNHATDTACRAASRGLRALLTRAQLRGKLVRVSFHETPSRFLINTRSTSREAPLVHKITFDLFYVLLYIFTFSLFFFFIFVLRITAPDI